jgi:2,3-bisphosphoglycerate-independent phosphoglycerate mutase
MLFIFLDGVGLGDDGATNPLAHANMPNLERLLGGKKLVSTAAPTDSSSASLLPLDTTLGVAGLPQSATGQTALLTGINAPESIGHHYGPKPTPEIAALLKNGNIFSELLKRGLKVSFLNAYPPAYFENIRSGRRIYSAIPLAAVSAGLELMSRTDLFAGQAVSADFTGQGWRDHLNFSDTPVLEPYKAGIRLAELSKNCDFAFFEYWLSDVAGHRQDMQAALALLAVVDEVVGGLLSSWDHSNGLILLTSDHGNLEDLSTRRHTSNPVPALIVGRQQIRRRYFADLRQLTDIMPAVLRYFDEQLIPAAGGSTDV